MLLRFCLLGKAVGSLLFLLEALTAGEGELSYVLYLRYIDADLLEALGVEPVVAVVAADHVWRLCLLADTIRTCVHYQLVRGALMLDHLRRLVPHCQLLIYGF